MGDKDRFQRVEGNAGAAVDSQGRAAPDPTQNVLDLVEAGLKRQDDLREAEAASVRREIALTTRYEEMLRVKEAERLDAIRKVDQETSARQQTTAQTTAQALAKTVIDTAEAARTSMAAAASATAETLDNRLKPLLEGQAVLQQRMFEQAGQTASQAESKDDRRATSGQTVLVVGVIAAVVFGFLGFLVAAAGLVLALTR